MIDKLYTPQRVFKTTATTNIANLETVFAIVFCRLGFIQTNKKQFLNKSTLHLFADSLTHFL